MCGLKHTSSLSHTLWSCQLESVRKDIECCFGILKMRFCVLSKPLPYHSKTPYEFLTKANNIMHSCCILHNWLLSYDGLDTLWTEEDYLSAWFVVLAHLLFFEVYIVHLCAGTQILTLIEMQDTTDLLMNTETQLKSAQGSVNVSSAGINSVRVVPIVMPWDAAKCFLCEMKKMMSGKKLTFTGEKNS